jgi:hypothetical protein
MEMKNFAARFPKMETHLKFESKCPHPPQVNL